MSYVPNVMLGSTASPSHGATFDSNHMTPGDGHDLRKTEMADQITDTDMMITVSLMTVGTLPVTRAFSVP